MRQAVLDVLKVEFLPEFLNRIDETIIFHPLGMDELTKIVESSSAASRPSSPRPGLTIQVSDAGQATTRRGGVRPDLRRPSAQADHPAADRQSPGNGPSAGPRQAG